MLPKKPNLTVRIEPELKTQLEDLARQNSRSVSNQLKVLLMNYFELEGSEKKIITNGGKKRHDTTTEDRP